MSDVRCSGARRSPAGGPRRAVGPGRAVGVPVLLALLLILSVPHEARAHASGQPPHATLSAQDDVVTIDWVAMNDDAAAVGVAIGFFPEEVIDAYLGRGPWEDMPSDEEVRELSQAPELRDYLLSNVEVTQDGRACPGQVRPAEDFIIDGARFTFDCHRAVDHVDVRIRILHDQDPLYRTFGVDGTYQTTVHTSSQPEHTWDFTGASAHPPGYDAGPAVPRGTTIGGGLAVVVVVVVALLAVRWWRRRRAVEPAPSVEPPAPAELRS